VYIKIFFRAEKKWNVEEIDVLWQKKVEILSTEAEDATVKEMIESSSSRAKVGTFTLFVLLEIPNLISRIFKVKKMCGGFMHLFKGRV